MKYQKMMTPKTPGRTFSGRGPIKNGNTVHRYSGKAEAATGTTPSGGPKPMGKRGNGKP